MRRVVRYALAAMMFVAMTIPAAATGFAAAPPTNPAFAVATVQPSPGEVVGVGYPVTVTFTKPIVDRAGAERTIGFTTTKPMTGRFNWVKDDTVQWIPDGFWPAHSKVTMLAGGRPTKFDTGAAVVGVASISAHTFTVSIDGQVAREMPASMGKPSRPTPVGNFTILEKDRTVIMDSRTIGIPLNSPEGYLITASYAERITWSGVYVHSAPWSVDSQGHANVSHGCINLSPDNAAWYYNTASVGDPVIVQS
ncbi:MAG: L,D-transpeptidase [Mycobacteriaceae bacterium]|nr:L,D-transpeptidase [Mycobacteriaceae bacterium]MBV9638655.1 L,D-transpeptidase [Mycobacteriaceae bacterium]